MKEIVVISGKGGTGKTSITASFGILGKDNLVLADCDVDAADLHLLFQADHAIKKDFYSGETAVIDRQKCNDCGICQDECRFNAIHTDKGYYYVEPLRCEGCGLCEHLCPEKAISMEPLNSGEYYISGTRTGCTMVHARLAIGAANSGKMVAMVKETARNLAEKQGKPIVLIDGSPGIGCPVISSLSGASYVILVTEPSYSGFNDLKRVIKLIENFKLPAACIINKSGLNQEVSEQIRAYLAERNIRLLCELPYCECFSTAILKGQTVVEIDQGPVAAMIRKSWDEIMKLLN